MFLVPTQTFLYGSAFNCLGFFPMFPDKRPELGISNDSLEVSYLFVDLFV